MRLDAFRRALLAAALLAPLAVAAQSAPSGQADMASGEVRRINREQNKITLRHGEIKSLEMPPMTMVFTVRDPKLLDAVKVGDRVLFRAVKEDGGTYVVTAVEPAQ
jgi:Cu(I)/Ag(I) efflux system protein CusF